MIETYIGPVKDETIGELSLEVQRLKDLIKGADKLLTPGYPLSTKQAQTIYDAIKAEAGKP